MIHRDGRYAPDAAELSPPSDALSDKDVLVLQLLATNVPRREIARRLGCSTVTVDRQVERLRSSYSARTTLQLVVRAVRTGVI